MCRIYEFIRRFVSAQIRIIMDKAIILTVIRREDNVWTGRVAIHVLEPQIAFCASYDHWYLVVDREGFEPTFQPTMPAASLASRRTARRLSRREELPKLPDMPLPI